MELKEMMYVRFKDKNGNTYIRLITKLANEYPQKLYGIEIDKKVHYQNYLSQKNILKASFDILDLIEEGDLIEIEYFSPRYKGRVTRLFEVAYLDEKYITLENSRCDFMLTNKKFSKGDEELEPMIKRIITKEQLDSVAYRI